MSVFSDKLTELRKAAGLSQGQLARRLGLTRQAISNLEADKNVPAWETVQMLAKVLDVSVAVFADPNIPLPAATPDRPAGRPRKPSEPPPEEPKAKRRKKA